MDAGVAALIAQWGGFGIVLAAVGWFAWDQHSELKKYRSAPNDHAEAIKKLQKEHAEAVQALQKEHAERLSAVQSERVNDAKGVAQTLLGLQAQFNESVNAMTMQSRDLTVAVEHLHQLAEGIDRRIELLERKGSR